MPESIWPNEIKLVSLPSAIFCTIFLWNGLVYIVFSKLPWQKGSINARHLFFGLTSFALALYAFATFNLYSIDQFRSALFWQKLQFFIVIPTFVFFNFFSVQFLKLNSYYLYFIMPLVSALFLPFVFIDEVFLSFELAPKQFHFFGYSFSILEASQGLLGKAFLVWGLFNLVILGYHWFLAYFKDHFGTLLPTASIIFLLTTINDVLVTAQVYTFIYLIEFGSFLCIIAMAIYLFKDYVNTSKGFYEQKNRLEAANQEIRFLVDAISHDFSAPLLSINGFITLIKSKKDLSLKDLHHYLERIEVNADHAQNLVQDLATYLRIGHTKEKKTTIDMAKLLEDMRAVLALPQYAELQLELTGYDSPFLGYERRLKQVLLNLVQNSLKYTSKNPVSIKIEITQQARRLQFSVSDNGPGIPKEIHHKIFGAFFRNHAQPSGSGLGLAIVKRIVEGFGGEIWVDSAYTQGARICFTWPCG